MFEINDIKNGITFLYEGNIYQVLEFLHVKPGKGPAFLRAKLKNLRTGATIEKTFNTNIKLEKAMIEKQNVQFLYKDGDNYVFMNMETYEQIELSSDQIGDNAKYLKLINDFWNKHKEENNIVLNSDEELFVDFARCILGIRKIDNTLVY